MLEVDTHVMLSGEDVATSRPHADRAAATPPMSSSSPYTPLWERRGPAPTANECAELSKAAQIPPRLVEFLYARGLKTVEQLQAWFRPSLKDLRDPMLLKDLAQAIDRLKLALARQESIVLYADYDLDGTSGLALALEAFQKLGFKRVRGYQPQRLTEGYGLHDEALERLKRETDCTLLVSIDLGITALHEVQTARSLGIDVIITDHHLPKLDEHARPILPEAVAVVNPNRGDCESGLGHLCGTGVIFYLVLALRRVLMEEGLSVGFDPKSLLDVYAIGTITDLVPLQAENRILVKHGLLKLAETSRTGLRELLKALDLWGRGLNAQDVAIRFAPKLNALSRMGSGLQPLEIYLEGDEARARELCALVLANNQERQASQKQADQAADQALRGISQPPPAAIVLASREFHRGVVGLVATRLAQKFGVPTFVGAVEGESGLIIGSARLPDRSPHSLTEAMTAAAHSLHQFGGHAMAAGFETSVDMLENLRADLIRYFEMQNVELNLRPRPQVQHYDLDLRLSEITPSLMSWLEAAGPFGASAPPPRLLLRDARVTMRREMKGGHLRLRLAQPGTEAVQAVWFSPVNPDSIGQGQRVDVLVEPQWNHYQGRRELQLLVQSIRGVDLSSPLA